MRSSLWGSKNTTFLIPTILGGAQSDPPPSEKRRLRPISAHNVSTVRAREKSSIIVNRKSTTRFSTSCRGSAYVTPKSQRVAQKVNLSFLCIKINLNQIVRSLLLHAFCIFNVYLTFSQHQIWDSWLSLVTDQQLTIFVWKLPAAKLYQNHYLI